MRAVFIVSSLIWAVEFGFFIDALRRLRNFTEALKEMKSVKRSYLIYCVMALFSVLAQVPIIAIACWPNLPSPKAYELLFFTNDVFSVLFQICVVFFFNKLITIEHKNREESQRSRMTTMHSSSINEIEDTEQI
jgi:hypothetical protein